MKLFSYNLVLLFVFMALSSTAFAVEPAYCKPESFFAKEYDAHESIRRDHVFRFGDVIILGAAIGRSHTEKVVEFAEENSTASASDKYCTWYYNEGAVSAEQTFNHYYVSNPKKLTTTTGPKEYRQVLKDQFSKAPTSFLSCIEKHKYLAMGCNGQMHRGPTVFGMLLSYSGCSSQNSLDIVNKLWGKNGVKSEVRQAIIQVGYELGNEDPEGRRRMQHALGY